MEKENQLIEKSINYIKNKVSETCKGCIWEGVCDDSLPCYDFSPVDEDSDSELDEYIKARRFEFDQDWQEYMREWN